MKRIAPLFFAACAALAQAEPVPAAAIGAGAFEDRVQLAKDAEGDEQYKSYRSALQKRNSRHFARAIHTCIARSPKPAAKTFVLVADITAKGEAAAVAVKPDNQVANCFASRFTALSFPKPPRHPGRNGFPVMMKVRVIP